MSLHTGEECREKCDAVAGTLMDILELVEYPRSDREQQVKFALEVALQDIGYIRRDLGEHDA